MRTRRLGIVASLTALAFVFLGGFGKETAGTVAPSVTSTVPVAGMTDVPVNQIISATFNQSMNPSTISATSFLLNGPGTAAVAGTVSYTSTGSVASFTPTAALAFNTTYTATITSAVTNTVGVQPAANYTWSFTTSNLPTTVTATVPVAGAVGVAVTQVLSATFSNVMNPATINALPLEGEGGLIDLLKTMVDPRKPRGVRHPVMTVAAIGVCAALTGARSFTAIAEWAQTLNREALRKLGSKRWTPPSEPTIRRVLQSLDANAIDAQIGQWVLKQFPLAGKAVAVDGKALRGAHDFGQRAPHLLGAILHHEGVVIGQLEVEEKTNEIPKLPELLDPIPLQGAIVTADAEHTQVKTARFLVENKQADYLFTVKDNQPTLRKDISDLKMVESFPSSVQNGCPLSPSHRRG
jgi:hypothetical protein